MRKSIKLTDEIYYLGRSLMSYDDTWSSLIARLIESSNTLEELQATSQPSSLSDVNPPVSTVIPTPVPITTPTITPHHTGSTRRPKNGFDPHDPSIYYIGNDVLDVDVTREFVIVVKDPDTNTHYIQYADGRPDMLNDNYKKTRFEQTGKLYI